MNSSKRPLDKVIVRSWGDEPVELWVYRTENNGHTVFVGPDGGQGRPIGLPSNQVLAFSVDAFANLRSAYESDQKEKLLAIYFDCTRYQDKVGSHA